MHVCHKDKYIVFHLFFYTKIVTYVLVMNEKYLSLTHHLLIIFYIAHKNNLVKKTSVQALAIMDCGG